MLVDTKKIEMAYSSCSRKEVGERRMILFTGLAAEKRWSRERWNDLTALAAEVRWIKRGCNGGTVLAPEMEVDKNYMKWFT